MNKDTIYFRHDYNARNDPKMVSLRMKYGWEGYGVFWALMEIMREGNAVLSLSNCEQFAYQLHMDTGKLDEYINFFIEKGLLTKEDDNVYSKRLYEDYNHMKEKSKKASDSAKQRWHPKNLGSDADAMRTHSDGNAKEDTIGDDTKEDDPVQSDALPEDSFELFWEAYGKKIERKRCESLWGKLSKANREKILRHVPDYVCSTQDPQYRKNPSTYLKNECWNDEIVQPRTKSSNNSKQPGAFAEGELKNMVM